ncbi:MAG: hypothetical protein ABIT71_15560 [Vicinamibacteraceae bacterium]
MLTRRSFALAPAAWLAARGSTAAGFQGSAVPSASAKVIVPESPLPAASTGAEFPAQSVGLVRDAVIAAHGNVARLRTLVDRQQTLAKATYDWGFGDWESALGGACHVGNREIAEDLIANGAQPTIFSAAMLGHLDVVRAFVAASPGIQTVRGPHSLSLMRHARAGGTAAKPVVDYLTALGDADPPPPQAPLTPEQLALIAGTYVVEGGGDEPVVIAPGNGLLSFALAGRSRNLRHQGSLAFSPAGADNVRVVFEVRPDAVTLAVHDPDVVLRATKAVKQ